ncbi:MAG: hypothetical protein AAF551_08770, partial [Bacteroidota bacterium]
ELKGCTFKTLFGEEPSVGGFVFKTPASVNASISGGLDWLIDAQQKDGGWGAGSHSLQHIRDPHAIATDPATTAMVGMALLRTGSTPEKGAYSQKIKDALHYLLEAVEATPPNQLKITNLSGTQIQTKLGDHIDAVLAAQFFNNILELDHLSDPTKNRIKEALAQCVDRIQKNQNTDGSIKGDGWAGVLQSALANNALEAAAKNDVSIDEGALERSRTYQEDNFDAKSGKVNTDKGAGVVLYSISGSIRASAQKAREVERLLTKAKQSGEIGEETEVSEIILEEIGVSKEEASKLMTSYQVYQAGKTRAQENDVLNGFGNNGGEEFLSFLQTGESIVIAGDSDWKKWYDDTSGRIISIQNQDGSWNGHHCITSPVFCTATCLLILSIDQDIERLQRLGDS